MAFNAECCYADYECLKLALFTESHYAECRYAECRYAECRDATYFTSIFRNF